MLIFGTPWDAPICDGGAPVPVPIGTSCMRCGELLIESDSGVLIPLLGTPAPADDGLIIGGAFHLAEHRECHLCGIVGHMVGVCTCTGWDSFSRAAALEVQRRVDRGDLTRSAGSA